MAITTRRVDLYVALYEAWGADTARGYWDKECPSLNQCAVTALVVQDYLGRKLRGLLYMSNAHVAKLLR